MKLRESFTTKNAHNHWEMRLINANWLCPKEHGLILPSLAYEEGGFNLRGAAMGTTFQLCAIVNNEQPIAGSWIPSCPFLLFILNKLHFM